MHLASYSLISAIGHAARWQMLTSLHPLGTRFCRTRLNYITSDVVFVTFRGNLPFGVCLPLGFLFTESGHGEFVNLTRILNTVMAFSELITTTTLAGRFLLSPSVGPLLFDTYIRKRHTF